MSATLIVVTADFRAPGGEVPTGEVLFDLSVPVVDGSESFPAGRTQAGLDLNGQIAQPLVANDSVGLVPSSSYWVTERIVGAAENGYYALVPAAPAGSRSVSDAVAAQGQRTISSATAAFTSNDIGAYVFSLPFAVPTQIVSVTSSTVAVLSTAALSTGTGLGLLIGASVDLSSLRPL